MQGIWKILVLLTMMTPLSTAASPDDLPVDLARFCSRVPDRGIDDGPADLLPTDGLDSTFGVLGDPEFWCERNVPGASL